jgi:CRISPR-associated protein Csh1
MPSNYTIGLAICFDDQGRFTGVKHWSRHDQVVYRSGPSGGSDFTACSKFGGDVAKTLKRLGRAASGTIADAPPERSDWWQAVADTLSAPDDDVKISTQQSIDESPTDLNNRPYLFLATQRGMTIDPAFFWPESKGNLPRAFLDSIGKSRLKSGHCQICDQGDRPVYGNFSLLKCYVLDKPGAIAGGFDEKRAVSNFPVCQECALDISQAIAFSQTHLRATVAGLSYFVLPSTCSDELRRYLRETVEDGKYRLSLSSRRDPLDHEERDLLDSAAELAQEGKAADLSLHFVFFKGKQGSAEWKITAEARQVLPSRLAELHRAARELSRDPMLAGGKVGDEPFGISTRTLSGFTGEKQGSKNGERKVREWLVALLQKQAVDRRAFIHSVARALTAGERREPQYFTDNARRAWGLVRYALATGLIDQEETMKPDTPASPYGEYCAGHPEFFTTQEQVAAFLAGCFVSVVCYVQAEARHVDRNKAPFAKKFRGRIIDSRLLRRLYHEGRDKLEVYDGLGYARDLDTDLAEALVTVGDRWTTSPDELTLAFTIGRSLQYRLHDRAKKENAASATQDGVQQEAS